MLEEIKLIKMDWDLNCIQSYVGKKFLSDNTKILLQKGISPNVKVCMIENPYVDKDFRDSYYNDFSKRHLSVDRNSYRIFLFSDTGYLGFITLRNTPPVNIGRSCIHPKACSHVKTGYYCLSKFSSYVKGSELQSLSFPWMQQDINSSVCAHIALWAIIRYISTKKSQYKEYTLHKISTLGEKNSRKVPSKGLTIEEIAQTFTKAGHSTEVYNKSVFKDILFYRICYSMIESGLPYVAGLLSKRHAISIIGHGTISLPKKERIDELMQTNSPNCIKINEKNCILDLGDYVDYYIGSDDNYLPYIPIQAFDEELKGCIHTLNDIDSIIVPLHEKMYLDISHIYNYVIPLLETNLLKDLECNLVRRIFLTSSNSFKQFLAKDTTNLYNSLNLDILMPQYVWVIEYFDINQYFDKILCRIILDGTGMVYRDLNELIISAKVKDILYFNNVPYKLPQTEEKPYINNLKEI